MSGRRGGGGRRENRRGRGSQGGGGAPPPAVEVTGCSWAGMLRGQPSSSSTSPPPPPSGTSPPSSSKETTRLATRPDFGTVGEPCVVRANHFLVNLVDKDLVLYDVAISPEVSKGVNRLIISELVRLYLGSLLGGGIAAFDGRKNLYTAGALPFKSKDDFVIELPQKDQTSTPRRDGKKYTVAIKEVGRADVHSLRQFLEGRLLDSPQDTIKALDIVLRQTPTNQHTILGQSFFSPHFEGRVDLHGGVDCWRGFYHSLRPTQMGLSLNIDISATSFYKGGRVTDFVSEYLHVRDLSTPLNSTNRKKLREALIGVRVETTYSSTRFRISDITELRLDELTFVDKKNNTMYVTDFFNMTYGLPIAYPHLPCLQAGHDKSVKFLPIEFCKIVPGQRYSKILNARQAAALMGAIRIRPKDHEDGILKMVEQNKYKTDSFARAFGLSVSNKMISINARVLPAPTLKYHGSTCTPQVGEWEMTGKKMVNGARVDYWTAINFSPWKTEREVQKFCNDLVVTCNSIGMDFKKFPCVALRVADSNNIESALRNLNQEIQGALNVQNERLQLLIVILPDTADSYGKIKKICETELGIVSQCLQSKYISKAGKAYRESVALKINVKVGGRNTVLNDAYRRQIPYLTDKATIIFGADVTHPPSGDDSSPSIAAVVASMDWPEVTKYKGLVSAQAPRKEMISDLYRGGESPGGMIRELLISFRQSTGKVPQRIIFYRDGVSDGQFGQVLLYELDQIKKACYSFGENYKPAVTFVVVQKRHHTRLFPEVHHGPNMHDPNMTVRTGNILPGIKV